MGRRGLAASTLAAGLQLFTQLFGSLSRIARLFVSVLAALISHEQRYQQQQWAVVARCVFPNNTSVVVDVLDF
jgi:hypothetical protein